MSFCSNCGQKSANGARFCANCGASLESNTATPIAQSVPVTSIPVTASSQDISVDVVVTPDMTAMQNTEVRIAYDIRLSTVGLTQQDFSEVENEINSKMSKINGGKWTVPLSRMGMIPCCIPCFFFRFATMLPAVRKASSIVQDGLATAVKEWQNRGIPVKLHIVNIPTYGRGGGMQQTQLVFTL